MSEEFITFLTDFGDTAPATCRGVIWSILPGARINDLSHETRAFAIRDGAFLLWSSLPYQPIGVHLAVVDPGVGTTRRAIALQVARGDRLVGPDNGLLMPAAERLGGVAAAHELTNRALWREPVSDTFHGRDLFAPVAAHLAGGTPIADVGPPIPVASLVPLAFPEPRRSRACSRRACCSSTRSATPASPEGRPTLPDSGASSPRAIASARASARERSS